MKVKEIIKILEELAPAQYQESYDNAGLITGSGQEEVKNVLVTLDCTEEIVEEAIQKDCNLIVAHHPIVFKGLKRLNGKDYVERTVIKAIKNDICIFAIHTNLDNMIHGVNKKIADLIGLENVKILSPIRNNQLFLSTYVPVDAIDKVQNALATAGAGKIGNYDGCNFQLEGKGSFTPNENANPTIGFKGKQESVKEIKIEVQFPTHLKGKVLTALQSSHPYEEVVYQLQILESTSKDIGSGMYGTLPSPISETELLQRLKTVFRAGVIKHTPLRNKMVSKVALCGGAGSFLLRNAIGVNADFFVSGDFKYHEFFDAEGKIVIADIGHYESEQFTSDLLVDHLSEQFPSISFIKTAINTNPVQCFV
ncbi:Nif3-like dinuclear metal center hexameric protein [Flammeovirga aprica]|uniref:GTP cyclohydrolase 1 type 2 homolog n=1 Tax=Flammeovirga aprica JL-4 TaxID=694437 RepID=A0A7X9RSI8_9BACT|nr:Nif3-like dinuclear metal center hexameric protein [Flammeovirga aprica]NME67126.1 Nif3-like dinuclear metal center hexameric protein [Flammeovirga aprica JL-4]